MTAIVRKLQSDRAERAIDLSVFGLGAASLTLALVLTLANALGAGPAAASDPLPASEAQAL